MGFMQLFKFNPYHDERGRFASKGKASMGGESQESQWQQAVAEGIKRYGKGTYNALARQGFSDGLPPNKYVLPSQVKTFHSDLLKDGYVLDEEGARGASGEARYHKPDGSWVHTSHDSEAKTFTITVGKGKGRSNATGAGPNPPEVEAARADAAALREAGHRGDATRLEIQAHDAKLKEAGLPLTYLIPTRENYKSRQKLGEYMEGFYKNLKDENELAYTHERVRQMLGGEPRPSGMSGKWNVRKERVMVLEGVIQKVFRSGRAKFDV